VANPTAARLAAGRTGTVAVVVPVFDSWYFAKVVAGVEAVLKERAVDLLLYAVDSEAARQAFLAGRGAWWQRGDALIMVDVRLTDSESERLARSGSRIVTIGSRTSIFSSVCLDEERAAALAADHLMRRGHRRIGVLAGDPHALHFTVPALRLGGFCDALDRVGRLPAPELIRSGGFSVDGGRDAMANLLDLDEPPTAVFCLSDEMAFGALDEIRHRGLRVPDDVAVVGFDNHDLAPLFDLTTVGQDVESIGAMAGRLVVQAMHNPSEPPEHVNTPTTLVVRGSA
jgi:DNA-binding LacI/PurR family transcriptional regulator